MFSLTFLRRIFYYSCSLLEKKKKKTGLFNTRDIIICKRLFPGCGVDGLILNLHFISGEGVFFAFLHLINILKAAAATLQALTSERNTPGVKFSCATYSDLGARSQKPACSPGTRYNRGLGPLQ